MFRRVPHLLKITENYGKVREPDGNGFVRPIGVKKIGDS